MRTEKYDFVSLVGFALLYLFLVFLEGCDILVTSMRVEHLFLVLSSILHKIVSIFFPCLFMHGKLELHLTSFSQCYTSSMLSFILMIDCSILSFYDCLQVAMNFNTTLFSP